MKNTIHREITPLRDSDCFLTFDRYKNNFEFPVHFHPEYELNYIVNAKGGLRIVGDHQEEIGEAELVLTGPNLYHGWTEHNNIKGKEFHEVTIQFPNELFSQELLNKNVMRPIKELLINSNQGILFSPATIEMVKKRLELLVVKRGFDSFIELQSLLYDLALSRDQRTLTNISFQRTSDFHNSERIEKVYSYLKSHYSEKIRVDDMAEYVNMSAVSFSRLIKQRTGKSFVEFLNEIRLGYATRWLIETNKSVSDISYECGFNNMSNFNRIFKAKQNCTPSVFRTNYTDTRKIQ